MFMEEQHGTQRVNTKRTLQLLDTGATTLATGCPFCMTMITDGLKAEEKEDRIGQKDVAEILAASVGVDVVEAAEAAQ
jgi:Fe-S oxidoreductase